MYFSLFINLDFTPHHFALGSCCPQGHRDAKRVSIHEDPDHIVNIYYMFRHAITYTDEANE